MTLFASLSSGAPASSFATRQPTYDSLIGQFSALQSQVAARPQPPANMSGLGGLISMGPATPRKDQKNIPLLDAPTKGNLQSIIEVLRVLRDTDKDSGLAQAGDCNSPGNPAFLCGIQRSYNASIDGALTYEMALQR